MNLFSRKIKGPFILILAFCFVWLNSPKGECRIIHVPAQYFSIQQAINVSMNGDTVLVDDGFYPEQVNFLGKNIVVASRYILDNDSIHIYNTEINRSHLNEGVKFINGEGPAAQLIGFTISNCLWKAVYCKNSSPRIRNNIISGNKAAGIYLDHSAAIISDNEIHCSPEFDLGGPYDAVHLFNSGPVIERNRILCNDQGGNVHAIDFDLWNSVFPGITTNVGENLILGEIFGGLPDNGLPQLIHHNIFTSGNGFSSAMNITECASNLKVFSNTVIGGSGIWIQGGNYPDIRNNIVAYANVGIEIWADTVTIAYNNIWDCKTPYSGVSDQTGINGNISADPGFIDRANGDFHFFCWSACIDAGDPLSDYLQEPAPNGGRINLGCYGNTSEADPTVACLRIIPEYIDFGYVPVNKQKDTTVILVNAGPVQLDISSVSNSNIISFGTSYPGGTTILNPGDSLTLIVVFHPFINKTHYSDSIIVTSNSPSPGNIYLNGHTALGLNDIETIRKLKLYPVPVTGDCFYLEPGTAWPREVLVEIFNISGKLVFSQMLIPQEGQPLKIYPGKLAAGMFFLKITSDSSPRKLGDIFFCIQPACPY